MDVSDLQRPSHHGTAAPGHVGCIHRNVRLLDRHRAFRHAHLRHPVSVSCAVAHVDRARRRDDDDRGDRDGRSVSNPPPGPRMALLLADSVSERARSVGELQLAAHLGRGRGRHLFRRQRPVLVSRVDSRLCVGSRSHGRVARLDLRTACGRLARQRSRVASLPVGLRGPGRSDHRARDLRAQHRVVGLRRGDRPGVAQHDLRAVFRRRGGLLRPGDDSDAPRSGSRAPRHPRVRHRRSPRAGREADRRRLAHRDVFVRKRAVLRLVSR